MMRLFDIARRRRRGPLSRGPRTSARIAPARIGARKEYIAVLDSETVNVSSSEVTVKVLNSEFVAESAAAKA